MPCNAVMVWVAGCERVPADDEQSAVELDWMLAVDHEGHPTGVIQ